MVEIGVRSDRRFPVCKRGRKLSLRLTTRTLPEAQRGQVTLPGSFSAISSFLRSVSITSTPQASGQTKPLHSTQGTPRNLDCEDYARFRAVTSTKAFETEEVPGQGEPAGDKPAISSKEAGYSARSVVQIALKCIRNQERQGQWARGNHALSQVRQTNAVWRGCG